METAASLRSFHCSAGGISHARPSLDKPSGPALIRSRAQSLVVGRLSSLVRPAGIIASCAMTPETSVSSKSNVVLNDMPNGSTKKRALRSATFPSAFEALVTEVCDETSVAELQLKVGEFEMYLKREIGGTSSPVPAPLSAPTEPIVELASSAPSTSASKASIEKANPFTSASVALSSKLASLEAYGSTGYILVAAPKVGFFRKGRTVPGKKQPPACKQGDVVKKGQAIGYIDQLGSTAPIKVDVAGEILRLFYNEGEAVGYGDPVAAILPLRS